MAKAPTKAPAKKAAAKKGSKTPAKKVAAKKPAAKAKSEAAKKPAAEKKPSNAALHAKAEKVVAVAFRQLKTYKAVAAKWAKTHPKLPAPKGSAGHLASWVVEHMLTKKPAAKKPSAVKTGKGKLVTEAEVVKRGKEIKAKKPGAGKAKTKPAIEVTAKERAMLSAIAHSDINSDVGGPFDQGIIDHHVWSKDLPLKAHGLTQKSAGGLIASLMKKGLIKQSGEKDEATVALTEDGFDVHTRSDAPPVTQVAEIKKPAAKLADIVEPVEEEPKTAPVAAAPAGPMTLDSFVAKSLEDRVKQTAENKAMGEAVDGLDEAVATQKDIVKEYLVKLTAALTPKDPAKIKELYNTMRSDSHLSADGAHSLALAAWRYTYPDRAEPALKYITPGDKDAKNIALARLLYTLDRDRSRTEIVNSKGAITHWKERSEIEAEAQAAKSNVGSGGVDNSDLEARYANKMRNIATISDEARQNAANPEALAATLAKLHSLDGGKNALNEHSKGVALNLLFPKHVPNVWQMERYPFSEGVSHADFANIWNKNLTARELISLIQAHAKEHGAFPDPTSDRTIPSNTGLKLADLVDSETDTPEDGDTPAPKKRRTTKKTPAKKAAAKNKKPAVKSKKAPTKKPAKKKA